MLMKKNDKWLRVFLLLFCVLFFILSTIFAYNGIKNTGNISQTVNVDVYKDNTDKIDINTCSKEALESLPDIGKVLAKRIIDGRPYKDIYELDRIKDVGRDTIEAIKDKVVCK